MVRPCIGDLSPVALLRGSFCRWTSRSRFDARNIFFFCLLEGGQDDGELIGALSQLVGPVCVFHRHIVIRVVS